MEQDKKAEEENATAMKIAMKKAIETSKGKGDLNALPNISMIGVVNSSEVIVKGPSYGERKAWAENLGKMKAENEAEKTRIEHECGGEGELLPPAKQAIHKAINCELSKIVSAIMTVDDGLKSHVAVAYLIRKVELVTEVVAKTGVPVGADLFLRDMVATKRFRYATASEKEALKNKTAPSHTVVGHGTVIVPLELTAANKVLAERLMMLIKTEKAIFRRAEKDKVAAMKAKATITLSEVLEGKVPAEGQKPIKPFIFLSAPKRKREGRDKEGKPYEVWDPSFNLLLEVKDYKTLHILEIRGGEKVVAAYEKMRKDKRHLLLTYVRAGKITNAIEGEELFKDLRHFLGDVLRGFENEAVEAKDSEKVVHEKDKTGEAMKDVTAEVAVAFGESINGISEEVINDVVKKASAQEA